METAKVNGREYTVQSIECGEKTRAHALANGWDGRHYLLTGKRGATYLAQRAMQSGEFHIICAA